METMAFRIKRLRIAKGLSQEELGDKLGLKRAAINKYETGHVENIKRSVIQKMAYVLDVSPAYLLAFDDEITANKGEKKNDKPPKKLPRDEQRLLDSYRELNDAGKEEAIKNIERFTRTPEFNKKFNEHDTFSELAEELA